MEKELMAEKIEVTWEPDMFGEYTLNVDPDDFVGECRDVIAVRLEDELERQLMQKAEFHCADFERYVDEIFAAAQKIEQEEEAASNG